MSSGPEVAPAPPADGSAGGGGGALFTIAASPFTAAERAAGGVTDVTAQAYQLQPLPAGVAEVSASGKRSLPKDGEPAAAASALRPPRPPQLDVSHAILVTAGQAKGVFRSPRGSSGSMPSPGGGGRRRQSSKMQGRVCIECGTTTTTQWRSQGLLCNGCGVKLIKGRLPMDTESMQRRWLRLPATIRDHPMWAAAQVVAEAQTKAARTAAAGEPWTCPGCGCASSDRVAGPCGLQFCAANCTARYTGRSPPGGAVAVAAAVTAPPTGAVAAAAAALGGNPSPTPSPTPAQKRRKQATPRSAADSLLSPLSLDSSGDDSSSMQAYSWQSTREDDASTSKDAAGATPGSRPPSSRRQRSGQRSAAAATPPGSAKKVAISTPTAAEAAAALLVLTESEELRIAADEHAAAIAEAARAAQAAAEAAAAAKRAPQPAPPAAATDAPAAASAGDGAKSARCAVATSLDLVMQMLRQNSGLPLQAASPAVPAPAALPVDSVTLYQQLITASATPEGAAAGLTGELVGKYLAAHTAPSRALAAAGGAGACGEGVATAIRAQQDQQARLVAAMVAEEQHEAAVALMKSVVQLAGLD
ncbi:hypothetical protein C2E21_3121 [Chlorella sorokiniana]|uniref:GATA-type domain-containing protein n=1 Tax=Chlorella sorokiniana TaxID=3076 RepID=A0A2P6TVR0_CHLSO|nr:hypothetical protein C2E21_3121 [Chlorella sorokiniana]|eukprot:PRW58150.1 hypothetical protein C2E21_3121 [Chlorella sorokiniana]